MALGERIAATGSANYAALTQQQWSQFMHVQPQLDSFWYQHGFMALDKADMPNENPDAGLPIVRITNLQKEAGDKVTIPMLMNLGDNWVAGTDALADSTSEENLAFYDLGVYIELARCAVGYKGFMSKQRSAIDMKAMMKYALMKKLGKRHDDEIFNAFYNGWSAHLIAKSICSTTTHPHILRVGQGYNTGADTEITEADKFNTTAIENARVKAADLLIPPIDVVNGDPVYGIVIHEYQLRDLRQDPAWIAATQEAYSGKGEQSPILSRAVRVFAGCAIHVSNKIASCTVSGAAGNTDGRKAILFGASAVALAIGQSKPWTSDKDVTDYDLTKGLSVNTVYGTARATYISDDSGSTTENHSSMLIHTYAKDPNA